MRRLVLATAILVALAAPAPAQAAFGFQPGTAGFEAGAVKQDGTPENRAGVHPFAFDLALRRNLAGGFGDGDLRDLTLNFPAGFLLNPATFEGCSPAAFRTPRSSPFEASQSGESCPEGSQVGTVAVRTGEGGGTTRHFGVFNLEAPYGSPLAIGFAPFGVPVELVARVREDDAGLSFDLDDLAQTRDLQSFELTLWGVPWDPDHDSRRGNCLRESDGGSHGHCVVPGFPSQGAREARMKALLTLPTSCAGPMRWTVAATSWQGGAATAEAQSLGVGGEPLSLTECKNGATKASVRLATPNAGAGTGLVFDLDVDDGGGILNPNGISRPSISTARVELPEGLTLNPSLGNGLGVCTEADFARERIGTPFGAGCPGASKIGTVEVEGMLGLSKDVTGFGFGPLQKPLTGSLFVAEPYRNRFGTLLAVYIVASLPERGLFVKSTGRVELDPRSGRMVATFEDLPKLLYENFSLRFREGQRPAMVSPPACGTYSMAMDLRAWGRPSVPLQSIGSFVVDRGARGGPCPVGAPPFGVGALAGTRNSQAGAATEFFLNITRSDGDQEITSYSAQLPPGLLGSIAGIPFCPDAAIEAAKSRSGTEELAAPSCPAASSVGRTLSGYGAGPVLAYSPGGLYLAGPYRGAPLSIVAVNAAIVGPWDLGTVVVRSAITVDPRSARIGVDSTASDPIPHIRLGVPLHLRDVRVHLDRPGIMRNPTSCERSSVVSTLTGSAAPFADPRTASGTASVPFQPFGCDSLGFQPRFSLVLRGGYRRGAHPALVATYQPRAGDANVSRVAVTLPRTIFLAQENIRAICTRAQWAAEACPPQAAIGRAVASTPLLDEPLEGAVYLRSSSRPLPDLVVALRGRGVKIELEGAVDSHRGGMRASFEGLPDAPVGAFSMTLFGGRKRGLLAVADNLCRRPGRANARLLGHANLGRVLKPRVVVKCPKKAKGKRQSGKRRRGGR
ncbi:MAG TPA: hypothetical protein VK889_00780 [Solirubrobacterales bacterium]|nr:hypothetical protein [Solirubrobacterales bacterium]